MTRERVGGTRAKAKTAMRPASSALVGHCTYDGTGEEPLIQRVIPWQVRSAVIVAAPDATWTSYMQWEHDTWIAVTVTDDLESSWWMIVEDPADEFSIYPVDKT